MGSLPEGTSGASAGSMSVIACSRQLTWLEAKITFMERISEQLLKWEPFPGLPRDLDTPSLAADYHNGFHVILAEPRVHGRAFRVEFEQPLAFRSVNESYRLKLIEPINSQLPWPAFKVEHSTWVEWFHDQSLGIYRDWAVEHFLFMGEHVIEVLSVVQPVITEIERPSTLNGGS